MTNAYFYNALCFILLHEVGHIISGHVFDELEDKQTAYACEKEADAWAERLMLEKCPRAAQEEKEFVGRCTGIALGLSILTGVEFYHYAKKDDHPTIAERLLNFFQDYIPEGTERVAEEREFPMYVATAIIHAQFMNAGVEFRFDNRLKISRAI